MTKLDGLQHYQDYLDETVDIARTLVGRLEELSNYVYDLIAEEEEEEEEPFAVGALVRYVKAVPGADKVLLGTIGVVRVLEDDVETDLYIGVEFAGFTEGHSLCGRLPRAASSGYFVSPKQLEHV